MNWYKGIIHTAEYTKEMAMQDGIDYSEEDIEIIANYMQAWDGIEVTLSHFVNGEFSVIGWDQSLDEKVKNAIYLMEQDPVFGQYKDNREEFDQVWDAGEWEPTGSIVFSEKDIEITETHEKPFREVIRECELRKQCEKAGAKKPQIKNKKCIGIHMDDGSPYFQCQVCNALYKEPETEK